MFRYYCSWIGIRTNLSYRPRVYSLNRYIRKTLSSQQYANSTGLNKPDMLDDEFHSKSLTYQTFNFVKTLSRGEKHNLMRLIICLYMILFFQLSWCTSPNIHDSWNLPTNHSCRRLTVVFPFYRWGNWNTERWGDSHDVTHQPMAKPEIEPRRPDFQLTTLFLFHNKCLFVFLLNLYCFKGDKLNQKRHSFIPE